MNVNQPLELPPPSQAQLEHSRQLLELIKQQIVADGPISFQQFMHMALYTPGLGYYASGQAKFGRQGDFITSADCGALFANCLANCLAPLFQQHPEWVLLEFGAGNGQFTEQLLSALAAQQALPKQYYILDVSADCKAQQQKRLSGHRQHGRVEWLDRLPDTMQGVVIANEVLDAMPVIRFTNNGHTLAEVAVDWQANQLVETTKPLDEQRIEHLTNLLPESFEEVNYQSEFNPNTGPWLGSLSDVLSQGLVLLIDYGFPAHEYYHPSRHMGTLMCHYRHHAHGNAFLYPGLQDITAHVDFTCVADEALNNHFDLLGYTNQAAFLMDNGILENNVPIEQQGHLNTLLSPAEMGELFKVMALGKALADPISGFDLLQLRL